ncbi:MAG: hypothetical protein ACW98J_10115 [Candidatus Thorarchaeota archaeon]|jgi:hypothetical protein
MNAIQGDSEKTLDESEAKLNTRRSKANEMSDEDLEGLPIWVL